MRQTDPLDNGNRDPRDAASHDFAAELALAGEAFERGNLTLAEMIGRDVLHRAPDHPAALTLLGRIACRIGRSERPSRDKEHPPRFLLVKAWGYGFWSDVDHVAGQLLLADMTGRVPVVHWGSNSLFGAPGVDNAFELYFCPVSAYALKDVAKPGATYFPSKWRSDGLSMENVNKWDGPGSRLTGLYFLNRDEDVVVSDFHTSVNDLVPWIDTGSPYHGLGRKGIYRRIFDRSLTLKAHLHDRIERYWQENMAGRPWLAVHVRGSDKAAEVRQLADINADYPALIDGLVDALPQLSIFLLTDSEPCLRDFQHRYGSRLHHSTCTRSATATGVHHGGYPGQRIAEEVILDTYVAARCDFFLGNGMSNVSTTVRHLKDWAEGSYLLLGNDQLSQRNRFLHQW